MAPRNTRVTPETEVRSPARSFLNSLDNFYAPSRDVRSERALQEGINAFSGIIGQKANRVKGEMADDERQQGIQDALREQAGQEMQGVRTGQLFRQHSRFYMAGLNETRGKAAAARFKAETAQAYQDWEGRHADDDGSGYREWMNTRVADFMGTLGDDQYRVAGALPVVTEVANNFAAQHTGFTAQRLEQESFEAYDEIISGVFTDLANGQMDMDSAVARIADEADDMYLTDGAAANNRVVDAAIRYANIHTDPDAILALARAHDSGRLPISQVNREKLANAMDAVEAEIDRNASKANSRATAAAKAARTQALTGWGAQLAADPYAELPSFSEVGDPQTYRDMVSLQDAFIKGNEVDNPEIASVDRMNLEIELHNAETMQSKLDILTRFTQSNPTALSGADIAKYSQGIFAESDPDSLINNQTIGRYRTGFGQTLAEFQLGDGFDINRSSYLRTQGERHYNDYMLSKSGKVDVGDPAALRAVVKEAEEYAMEQLAFDFPEVLREKQDQSPLGTQLGAGDALANRDAVVAEQAAEYYENLAAGGEGAPEVPAEVTVQPDVPIEDQPTPFEDPETDDVLYSPTREGFYGEMIQRFTDGRDDRLSPREITQILDADPEFAAGIDRLGAKYGVNPMAILAVMYFETGGTFGADTRNAAGSGATGLIQFMPSTAEALGTTTEALARMSKVEQLVYVEKYFDQFQGKIQGGSVDDLYMAVLWPRAIGKPEGYALFNQGTTAYEQNRGLDTNGDGQVTKFEAAAKVKAAFYGY